MSNEQLEKLATEVGLSVHWVDANARPQTVSPDVLRNVLDALGYPAHSREAIDASLLRVQTEHHGRQAPPLLTVDVDSRLDLSAWFEPQMPFTLHMEDGTSIQSSLDADAHLPAIAPVGYQQLDIADQRLTIAVAPLTSFSMAMACADEVPRAWGLTTQVYSLRREGDGGFGDTQALEGLARAAGERGADALAISPLHAMFADDPQRYSPYSPSSRLFFNSLYASPALMLGERAWRQAIEDSGQAETLQQLEQLPLIDWPAAAMAKWQVLRKLYEGFSAGDHPLRDDFNSFRVIGGEALENHCRFEAIREASAQLGISANWHEWPEDFKQPRSQAVALFAAAHAHDISFHAFTQWLVARGLERAQVAAKSAGMRIGLIADLAVGADGAGSQAWSRQDELLSALTVGAPPDILNRAGQSWGISAFSPEGLKRNGFRAFIEMLRANFAHAGGLRIDHVMGLQRLWVIPLGASPKEGAYLNYPLNDMLRLLCLESVRHKAIVLGEDLGTVPEGLSDKLSARAILGMRVLLFEQHNGQFKPILDWSPDALATTSTHDLPTLAGWINKLDIEWHSRLGHVDEQAEHHWREERSREYDGLRSALSQNNHDFPADTDDTGLILDASIRYLGHTRAPLVLLPVEDALGVLEQANLPGTIDSHPNWRRRLEPISTTLLDQQDAARRLELLSQARQQAAERDR